MTITLYGDEERSLCANTVALCLREKELEFEEVRVNPYFYEDKRPPYSDMNPFGQVPILEDDGLILFEIRAITAYLAEQYKGKGNDLIGKDHKEEAMVRLWVEVEAHQFTPAVIPFVVEYHSNRCYGTKINQAVIDEYKPKLEKVLDIYDAQLAKTKYLAGDFFSLADLHHISKLEKLTESPFSSVLEDRPHVKKWWDRLGPKTYSRYFYGF